MTRGTFPESADSTIEKVRQTYTTREGEYGDSFHLDNQAPGFLRTTLARFGVTVTPEQLRLIQLASLIDTKMQRMIGPFKEDTLVDLIAYVAVYNELRAKYERRDDAPNPTAPAGESRP